MAVGATAADQFPTLLDVSEAASYPFLKFTIKSVQEQLLANCLKVFPNKYCLDTF